MSKRQAAALKATTTPAPRPDVNLGDGRAINPAPPTARSEAAVLHPADVKEILTQAQPIEALQASEIWAREAGIKFNTWEVVPKAGTPFANVLRPDYWVHVSAKMKGGDKVIIYPRDGAYYGELVVWDAGQNWAHVTGGSQARPSFEPVPGIDAQFVTVNDPIDGWCVDRKATGQRLKKNCTNQADAQRWIVEHQRVLRT